MVVVVSVIEITSDHLAWVEVLVCRHSHVEGLVGVTELWPDLAEQDGAYFVFIYSESENRVRDRVNLPFIANVWELGFFGSLEDQG